MNDDLRRPHAPTVAYTTTRFNSAPPIKQRIAILEGAIAAALATSDSLENGLLETAHERASLCRGLLLELAWMIRGDSMPQLASAMTGLTVYLHGLMVAAMTERSPERARLVARLLESERSAWAERLVESRAAPWRANAVA